LGIFILSYDDSDIYDNYNPPGKNMFYSNSFAEIPPSAKTYDVLLTE